MNFVHLTEKNARNYMGFQLIFKLNDKPILATLCNKVDGHFVIDLSGNKSLISVKHPIYVIIDNNKSLGSSSIHYSMNFIKASPNNIQTYVGHYITFQKNGGKVSLTKIKNISKSLCYISTKESNIDIRTTNCYVIV